MKSLIAYYSHTGTTRRAAEAIRAAAGGDLYEIRERDAYPRAYNAVLKRAKQEIGAGTRPPLQGALPDISGYDVVFVGSPNWWSTIAPPVASFLDALDFAGKRIVPFITHGGGGLGRSAADVRRLCPDAAVEDSFDANRSDRISAMVRSLLP